MEQKLISTDHHATVEIDNTQGSTRLCKLTNNSQLAGSHDIVDIEFSPNNGQMEIDGVKLSNDQRITLLRFLTQTDSGYVSGGQCIYNIKS